MKRLSIVLVLFLVLAGVPGVQAAAEAVPGVRILVTGTDATDAFYTIRFAVSPDDPNQDTGDYTYNYTRLITGGSWTTHESDVAVSGGFGEVTDDFTLGQEVTVNITADANDGSGPVDSCTVTLTLTEEGQYDVCGSFDSANTFNEVFCLDDNTDTESGFNYEKNTEVSGLNIELDAKISGFSTEKAVGALNLGGDTDAIKVDFQHRFKEDGLTSGFRVFLSERDVDVSASSFGNGETSGAFTDGLLLALNEDGDDYDVGLAQTTGGSIVDRGTWQNLAAGTANTFTAVSFIHDPTAGLIIFEVGAESFAVSNSQISVGTLYSLWFSEGWIQSASSFIRGGDSMCVSTSEETPARIGVSGTSGQSVEDFDGEGGIDGDPMFPGLSVTDQAAALDLEEAVFAWILAGLAILGFAFLGFMVASIGGAGLGAVLGLVASVVFNLIPLWLIVILFLLAVTVIVFGVKAGD